MYLKEIEIQGFKSFADKTRVIFDQGVTAVVGPNGSGKSNITESLRWALGESSVKSLRGGKMPDVIFAGTETRKPLNYACVTVVLDNRDGFIKQAAKEIRVERHIYRSGDSEYKIDGKKVRLRDVHDLFMDTGLGRDSFSIISQGKVEEIFNSKPEERRAIFEEAAGVLKFKTRRKETESKLIQTQDNLDRLEDIIFELEGQIKPLEKQALVAKRFLELDQQRQVLYLDVLIAQIEVNKKDYDQAVQEETSIQEQLKAYYQKREEYEAESLRLKQSRQTLQHQLSDNQASLLELTRLLSDLEKQIELARLESQQVARSRQENQERVNSLEERLQVLRTQLEEKQANTKSLQEELQKSQVALEGLEKELASFSEDPDQVIDYLREKYVALMQDEAERSNELTTIENQLEASAQLSQSKKEDYQNQIQMVTELQEKEQVAQEAYQGAQEHLKHLLETYQSEAKRFEEARQAYQEAQAKMFDLLDQSKEKQARINSLEAIQKNHSNFYAGVKSVLQEAPRLGGIVGAVSEKLSFSPEYQTALEIALGASSQHIIVEDEGAATRAIEHLKKNRSGRATFLPLTTIKPRYLTGKNQELIEACPGFLGIASSLVDYDPSLESIFQNLLGVTAIFDTIEHAKTAARKVAYQVRIVTLDGTELRTGGSYAGGANRSNNSIFIKPELDRLHQELASLQKNLREVEGQVQEQQDQVTQSQETLESLKGQGEGARLEEQRLQLAFEQAHQQLLDAQELLELIRTELDEGSDQELLQKRDHLQARLKEIEAEKEQVTAEIEEVKLNKDVVVEKIENLRAAIAKLQLQKTELKSRLTYDQTDAERLQQELASTEREIQALQYAIEQGEDRHEQIDVSVLEKQLQATLQEKTALEQAVIRKQFELEDLEGQSDDVAGHMEQARRQNEEWIRLQAKAESNRDRLADKLNKLMLALTDEFKMSFEEASNQANELENLAQSEQVLKDLEKAIKALGPVNIDAIEQYDEVKTRFDFLSGQREDVLAAKNLLLETINDMNDEVKERFKSTFEAIRESFRITFKQMFGGGSADLILTDGDLLSAGVEISVQPPGKKIQSLNLMSGGEKALSALALLFSIIRVKTIPFVILDEVEAALDEANVKRFGDYLNRFDKESQFIVVTHRKGTMAAADSIYGVTMQESGVSKIVSVKLKDIEGMDNGN